MKSMKHIASVAAVAAIAVAGVTATAFARDGGRIKSDMLIGVPATMLGTNGTIRGVNGPGAPWSVGESEVSVKSSGKVEVEFDNLVITTTGVNPVGSMAVVVSCLDAANKTVNFRSAPFAVTTNTPTDPGGDAEVETSVDLQSPCFAPIVFITTAAGDRWFAVDGL